MCAMRKSKSSRKVIYKKEAFLRPVSMANNDLSGGEKQKVSMARCLFKDTDLLILDEPTNTLDSSSLDWLCDFIAHTDKTLLYISHDDKFTALADKVIRL